MPFSVVLHEKIDCDGDKNSDGMELQAMMKLNGLELQATKKSDRSELQDTTKFNPMIGLELQSIAKYQFNSIVKRLAAMLGAHGGTRDRTSPTSGEFSYSLTGAACTYIFDKKIAL